jgi:pre-mRNA-splicing factor ISY1
LTLFFFFRTRYFGRARDLPGVRELFEKAGMYKRVISIARAKIVLQLYIIAPESTARSRSEINRDIDADYYGYRDEEDSVLLEYEKALEKELIEKLFNAPDDEEQTSVDVKDHKEVEQYTYARKDLSKEASTEGGAVPTQKEVEAYLVQRRKQQVNIFYIKAVFAQLY